MAEAKTKPTGASVDAFIDAIEDDQKREDCRAACLYVKRLSDVDQGVLKELVKRSVAHMKATNP